MKQRIAKKNRGGFTLAETLIAVLILLMVTGIVAAGIPAASEALTKAVDASHGQVLLSTTMTALRDELATARSIGAMVVEEAEEAGEAEDGEAGDDEADEAPASVVSFSYVDSSGAKCVLESRPDGIYLTKEATPESATGVSRPGFTKLLVSKEAATENLYAAFDSVSYSNGIVKIMGLRVYKNLRDGSKQVLSDLDGVDFEIEVIGRKG